MKKLVYGGLFLALVGIGFVACEKEVQNRPTTDQIKHKDVIASKSLMNNDWETDSSIISAIIGDNVDYISIASLEDLLYDNAKLSDEVIQILIAADRVPDYVVETSLILSAPISQSAIDKLRIERQGISISNIARANDIPASVGFAIINTPNRIVIFGNDINKSLDPENENCGCGKGIITIESNFSAITVGSTNEPLPPSDPNYMKPCTSSNGKWACGDVVYADQTGGGPSHASYDIDCAQSTNKCFKWPRDARRDYDLKH